jgi:CRISPR/Cas system-associated protein Cas7 (RAMP superfamily)
MKYKVYIRHFFSDGTVKYDGRKISAYDAIDTVAIDLSKELKCRAFVSNGFDNPDEKVIILTSF